MTPRGESSDVRHWSQCCPGGSRSTQLKSSVSVTTAVLSADARACAEPLAAGRTRAPPSLLPHTHIHRKTHAVPADLGFFMPPLLHATPTVSGTCQGPGCTDLLTLPPQPLGKLALQAQENERRSLTHSPLSRAKDPR